nr:hypothetical protein [Tanacetum cinerariifolium]
MYQPAKVAFREVSKFEAQELEINSLKARIKLLEDKDRGVAEQSRDDSPISKENLLQDNYAKVHTEGQRSYWKIIRLGGISASYRFFVDMLKHLDREDLNQLWGLVKETLSIRPTSSNKRPRHLYADREGLSSEEGDEFPLPEQLPTANKDKFPLLIQSDATAVKFALLLKSRNN